MLIVVQAISAARAMGSAGLPAVPPARRPADPPGDGECAALDLALESQSELRAALRGWAVAKLRAALGPEPPALRLTFATWSRAAVEVRAADARHDAREALSASQREVRQLCQALAVARAGKTVASASALPEDAARAYLRRWREHAYEDRVVPADESLAQLAGGLARAEGAASADSASEEDDEARAQELFRKFAAASARADDDWEYA